jgi:hypothetical protein
MVFILVGCKYGRVALWFESGAKSLLQNRGLLGISSEKNADLYLV